jgi:hypothetical protein
VTSVQLIKERRKTPEVAEAPASPPQIYVNRPIPVIQVSDPNSPGWTPKICDDQKLCAIVFRSCRCTVDGVCKEIECQDEFLTRYCFCAWQERPTQ